MQQAVSSRADSRYPRADHHKATIPLVCLSWFSLSRSPSTAPLLPVEVSASCREVPPSHIMHNRHLWRQTCREETRRLRGSSGLGICDRIIIFFYIHKGLHEVLSFIDIFSLSPPSLILLLLLFHFFLHHLFILRSPSLPISLFYSSPPVSPSPHPLYRHFDTSNENP